MLHDDANRKRLIPLRRANSRIACVPRTLVFWHSSGLATDAPWDQEAIELAKLTGRDVNEIRAKMASLGYSASAIKGVDLETPKPKKTWWQRLWGKG